MFYWQWDLIVLHLYSIYFTVGLAKGGKLDTEKDLFWYFDQEFAKWRLCLLTTQSSNHLRFKYIIQIKKMFPKLLFPLPKIKFGAILCKNGPQDRITHFYEIFFICDEYEQMKS